MKKGDAAAAAELRLTDAGWLTEVLRNREVPKHVACGYWDSDDKEADADPDTSEKGGPVSDDQQEEAEAV